MRARWLLLFIQPRTTAAAFRLGTVLGLIIEAVTLIGRYLGDIQVTRDTTWLASLTFGYRIHHGYIGLLLLLLALLFKKERWRGWMLAVGWALLLSDLLHHFVFLWALEGDPQFHIRY